MQRFRLVADLGIVNDLSISLHHGSSPLEAERAFLRIRPEIDALGASSLNRPLHVPYALSVVLGQLPALEQLLPAMSRHTPRVDVSKISRLREYGLAGVFAHHQVDAADRERLMVATDAYRLRRRLLATADLLAEHDVLDPARVAKVSRERGYIGVGDGLLALAGLFDQEWPKISGRAPLVHEDVQRAFDVGTELLAVARPSSGAAQGEGVDLSAVELRRRTAFLLHRVYQEARHVAAFIAWYEPRIRPWPSLYRGQASLRRGHRDVPSSSLELPQAREDDSVEWRMAAGDSSGG